MDDRAHPVRRGDSPGAVWLGALRLGLPLAVSVLVHAIILLLLIGVAWRFSGTTRGGDIGPPVMITLSRPPDAPEAAPQAPAETGVRAPLTSPAPGPPPALTGLSASTSPPPALRSSVPDGAVPVLRPGAVQVSGATFAGLGTKRARSVVYAVDASGAMVTNFKWIKGELQRSVAALSPTQKFQVVLFRDQTLAGEGATHVLFDPGESTEPGLLPATGPNKAALARWLDDVQPSGRSNPLDGVRRALELEPDVIFLLSRGIRRTGGRDEEGGGVGMWGMGADATLAELDQLNPPLREGGEGDPGPRMVVIKTIQFLEEDPTGIMRAIGERHGDGTGSYRVVTLRELGGR